MSYGIICFIRHKDDDIIFNVILGTIQFRIVNYVDFRRSRLEDWLHFLKCQIYLQSYSAYDAVRQTLVRL
jgi:hypothetical protein